MIFCRSVFFIVFLFLFSFALFFFFHSFFEKSHSDEALSVKYIVLCVVEYVNHCCLMWMQVQQFCLYCTEGADMPIFVVLLNKWFACWCIIPRFLSSSCSSLSMYLLRVLVLSRMEPVIQNLFAYLWGLSCLEQARRKLFWIPDNT